MIETIGRGKFAKVKKVIDPQTKEEFAMKIINKHRLKKKIGKNKTQFSFVEKEIAITKKMSHPYIVKLIEIIDDMENHHKLYLVLEYAPGGDLLRKIQNYNKKTLTEAQIRKYFRQLIYAIWYCHEIVNAVHRDIKPDNILLDENDNIKLSDFGVGDTFAHKC